MFKGVRKFVKSAGPGVITGAADDDPSGIATYSQTGAQFGYGQLWTALFMLPFMISVQEACARIGATQGKGIAAVIKEHYKKWVLYSVVFLVLLANTINIGADLGAMGAAAQLIIPLPFGVLVLFFAAIILVLEIFVSYKNYVKILKWATLALLAYPLTVFLIRLPWKEVMHATLIPNFELSFAFLFIITGVLGTTISPYMFFWQASEEVEEERANHLIKDGKPAITKKLMKAIRMDTVVGMISSNLATWCIIVVAGTVLFANGITNIRTAADAAKALEPLVNTFPNAGFLAKLIFSIGILGLGFLGIPVLSASASYAVSEAFNWKEGLNRKFKRAHGFYGVITVATLVGLMINFIGIDPMKALVFTAVFNGVAAVPLIFVIARIAQNKKIMGEYTSGILSKIFIWLTFVLMGVAAVLMFYTLTKGV
ncbi:MAG: Natural resistance-associated macrophage protein [Parcubacteria group bacterium LiPW_41]|nr:MAG: Natural resistance-associated macrophage protein [Parcubacteria group bacterium LiPW_41]